MLCHLWRALFKGQEYIAIKKIQISGLKEVHRKIKNLTGEFPGHPGNSSRGTKIPQVLWPKKKKRA